MSPTRLSFAGELAGVGSSRGHCPTREGGRPTVLPLGLPPSTFLQGSRDDFPLSLEGDCRDSQPPLKAGLKELSDPRRRWCVPCTLKYNGCPTEVSNAGRAGGLVLRGLPPFRFPGAAVI
jgi:hypothetical protein